MYFIDNQNITDPALNIALETYLAETRLVAEPLLLFYVNRPSIIVGRNQNILEEVNQSYVDQHRIDVVRRMSGGGTVYHDLGNLNYCLIKDDDGTIGDFKAFTQPIVDVLQQMGATGASLDFKSSLMIEGMKFSGTAMYAKKGRMIAHGTLLFDSDLTAVNQAIKPRADRITSKAVQSVRRQVTNLKPFLQPAFQSLSIEAFREQLLLSIFGVKKRSDIPEYRLTSADWQAVNTLKNERFNQWDWNYGQSPACHLKSSLQLGEEILFYETELEKGRIKSFKLVDLWGNVERFQPICRALEGVRFRQFDLQAALFGTGMPSDFEVNDFIVQLVNGLYE